MKLVIGIIKLTNRVPTLTLAVIVVVCVAVIAALILIAILLYARSKKRRLIKEDPQHYGLLAPSAPAGAFHHQAAGYGQSPPSGRGALLAVTESKCVHGGYV